MTEGDHISPTLTHFKNASHVQKSQGSHMRVIKNDCRWHKAEYPRYKSPNIGKLDPTYTLFGIVVCGHSNVCYLEALPSVYFSTDTLVRATKHQADTIPHTYSSDIHHNDSS